MKHGRIGFSSVLFRKNEGGKRREKKGNHISENTYGRSDAVARNDDDTEEREGI